MSTSKLDRRYAGWASAASRVSTPRPVSQVVSQVGAAGIHRPSSTQSCADHHIVNNITLHGPQWACSRIFRSILSKRSEWWTLDRAFERHCNHDRVSLDQRNMTPSLFSPSPRWSKSFSQQCQTSYIWLGNRPTYRYIYVEHIEAYLIKSKFLSVHLANPINCVSARKYHFDAFCLNIEYWLPNLADSWRLSSPLHNAGSPPMASHGSRRRIWQAGNTDSKYFLNF